MCETRKTLSKVYLQTGNDGNIFKPALIVLYFRNFPLPVDSTLNLHSVTFTLGCDFNARQNFKEHYYYMVASKLLRWWWMRKLAGLRLMKKYTMLIKRTTTFTPADHHNLWKLDLISRFLWSPSLLKFPEW